MSPQLHKPIDRTIGVVSGAAYCVTILVGAGILGLPGAAFQIAGGNAFFAWLFDFIFAIPLLFIFGRMGSRLQTAGGLSDFIKAGIPSPWVHLGVQITLLITLFVGIAGIAMVGADYLATAVALQGPMVYVAALSLIVVPALINSRGVSFGSRVQVAWASALILFLVVVILSSVKTWSLENILSFDPGKLPELWRAMGLVWFAFTGVEMISFLAEDFKSPRAFVLSIVLGFIAVGFLYLGLAVAVSANVDVTDPRAVASPLTSILGNNLGPWAKNLGGYLGFALILINLNAAILGASRLIFSIGRDARLLPVSFGSLNKHGAPIPALALLTTASGLIIVISGFLHWEAQKLLLLTSQNWFLLYVLTILAFFRLEKNRAGKIIALIAFCFAFLFMKTFSVYLIVPASAFAFAAFRVRKYSI